MTPSRFRVRGILTQQLSSPQPTMPHSVHHLSRVSHQGTESGILLLSAKVAANAGKESLKPRCFVEAHLADLFGAEYAKSHRRKSVANSAIGAVISNGKEH
jgi:hypothetical protein